MANHGGKREGAGRKKGEAAIAAEKARKIVVKLLEKEWTPIVKKAIEQAKGGDERARQFLAERGYGKVVTPVDHTTDGEAVDFAIVSYKDVKDTDST